MSLSKEKNEFFSITLLNWVCRKSTIFLSKLPPRKIPNLHRKCKNWKTKNIRFFKMRFRKNVCFPKCKNSLLSKDSVFYVRQIFFFFQSQILPLHAHSFAYGSPWMANSWVVWTQLKSIVMLLCPLAIGSFQILFLLSSPLYFFKYCKTSHFDFSLPSIKFFRFFSLFRFR